MDLEPSDGEDQEVTSEILNETDEDSDYGDVLQQSNVPAEVTDQTSVQPTSQMDNTTTSPITRSVTILPPIPSTVKYDDFEFCLQENI